VIHKAPEPAASQSASSDRALLYQTELEFVWRTLRRMGAPPNKIEDLTHDVFEQAFQSWETFDRRRPVRPWLFGIAFRVQAAQRRRLRSREQVGVDEEVADQTPLPEQLVSSEEERRLLQAALDSLDPERKAIIVMYYLEQWSFRDIAEVFPAPLNTLRSRLRLARQKLSELLEALRP
jgi:RNA polymerase sigma-70 factor (ECF subfamily)